MNEAIRALYLRVNELTQLGMWDAAQETCTELVRATPQDALAWYCLGEVERQRNRLADAIGALQQAASLAPDNVQYCQSLAVLLQAAGRWQEVAQLSHHVLTRDVHNATSWQQLAAAERRLGRTSEATAAFQQCLALSPDRDDVAIEYADLLCRSGQAEQARTIIQAVTQRNPGNISSWMVLAMVGLMLKDWALASQASQQALHIDPRNPHCRMLLAVASMRQWQLPETEALARELVQAEPQFDDAWALLGAALKMQAKTPESIQALEQAARLSNQPGHHSVLLLTTQYLEGQTPQTLLAAHRQWADRYCPPAPLPPVQNPRLPLNLNAKGSRPLRLGFVSGDLGIQATSYLALPALEVLAKQDCELTIYSDRSEPDDAVTPRFRAIAQQWRDIGAWTDEVLCQQIRGDHIDILVDLMGHTGKRLTAFAKHPAPLQVSWLGYVGTTGVPAMDALIADRFHVPAGEEQHYVEDILRMPHGYVCYHPIFATPEPSPLPALKNGWVTFGCFNNPVKYTATLWNAWAEILRRCPQARLRLKFGGLDHPALQARLRAEFAARGIQPDRLLCEGWSPPYDALASYHRVDLALDTQPYSGGVTTCEALWMGVPVVTWPGNTFAGRHSTSHLANADCPQFVARDAASYVDLAVAWAQQPQELAALRGEMRQRLLHSPLGDAPRFAADLLDLLRGALVLRSGR